VVLSRTASVGFVTIMGREMATSQDFVNWVCGPDLDPRFLAYLFRTSRAYLRNLSSGAIHQTIYMPTVEAFEVCLPDLKEQKRIVSSLDEQIAAVDRARAAAEAQLEAARAFPEACIRESLRASPRQRVRLAECLREVSGGVGPSWSRYPLLGATRAGIAPAKEAVGKAPARYKLVDAGTIFYNPMRILLGSIAMVDDSDETGITSPDYVVFKPQAGTLHPRWFYYWLRGHEGAAFIKTLARGAVRERMLFRRLTEAEVEAPSWRSQVVAAEQMRGAKAAVIRLEEQVTQIEAMPAALLRRAFSGEL
jgi:type I restriction enzyme S subunit